MNISFNRVTSVILLAIVVTVSIIGCAQIRKLTYPEDFIYLEKKEVEALMQKMGESIGRLDQLVADATPSDADQQQKIIAELSKLEKIATRLSGGHKQTNQLVISDHIEQFISDIGTAKMFANLNPPKYYKVTNVTAGCSDCHQFNKAK
jgi:cytochrome c556